MLEFLGGVAVTSIGWAAAWFFTKANAPDKVVETVHAGKLYSTKDATLLFESPYSRYYRTAAGNYFGLRKGECWGWELDITCLDKRPIIQALKTWGVSVPSTRAAAIKLLNEEFGEHFELEKV